MPPLGRFSARQMRVALAQGQWQCTVHHLTPGYATLFILSLLLAAWGERSQWRQALGPPVTAHVLQLLGGAAGVPRPERYFRNLSLQPDAPRSGTWVCKIHGLRL